MNFSEHQHVSTAPHQILYAANNPTAFAHPEAAISGQREQAAVSAGTAPSDPLLLLESRMANMRHAIAHWKSQAHALQESGRALEAQNAVLQQEITVQAQKLSAWSLRCEDMEKIVMEKEQIIAEQAEKMVALEGEATILQSHANGLTAEQNQLHHKLSAADKTIIDLEAYIMLLEQDNSALKQQVNQMTGTNGQLLTGLTGLLERFTVDEEGESSDAIATLGQA
ncbi:MAG: hypothetical protein HQL90_03305 [Magnetococcales bacterium]|nr:hypothetical protein [Magnetococcales bacterium]